ncbi:MAG: PilZ domain-containing protein [Gammaproteobacteria bacterium]|nr:PilZ domain-containing protein [Gammaproteobacteria bacterium]MDJ0890726.1 PilZ domain-containing protein [Gammaproteobacteria bacterium]
MHVDSERRAHPRVEANLVVSYRDRGLGGGYDISQSKNVSQGGMLLTTNRGFSGGSLLTMTLRLPHMPDAIEVTGKVVTSREIVRELIYDTHVQFARVDDRARKQLKRFVFQRGQEPHYFQ